MLATPPTAAIHYDRKHYSDALLLELYESLLMPRLIEEKMLILLRQSKISKWFSGIGQEAIAVGCTKALHPDDYIFPLHRNLGVFTSRNVDLVKLIAQWQGKVTGFTKGRDRSFHFGAPEYRIIGMVSHLGALLPVADGVSLASNLEQARYISLAFSGDGGTSEGEFHEAINVASTWDLPVIFLIENNGYGLSTPSSEQFRCRQLIDKAIGYGVEGYRIDGNNILEVYDATLQIADYMRHSRRPVILEAMTFRMRGHEEASGVKYVPKELMDTWALKDPVVNYEQYLISIGLLTAERAAEIRLRFKAHINEVVQQAFDEPEPTPNTADEIADVYKPHVTIPKAPPATGARELRYVDAIQEGLRQSMELHPNLILMGQDIAEYGGVFKVTQGFIEQFGKSRVRNTPICEAAIIGCGLGLSLRGYKSMVEMQFADFVSCGFNQIVNNLAKTHYRWRHAPDVVIRMPTGGGVAAGPFHSQSDEGWFFHTPGLKIVYPSSAYDAKGLLTAALEDPNPVLFFEHKKLYRSIQDAVPEEYYTIPIGKARIVKEGSDVTVITYGLGVHWALEAAKTYPSIEIIDLRTLSPWDKETVFASVRKTGKCLIVHEATQTGGIGAELATCIQEENFQWLDAPVIRLGALDTPVPFHAALEEQFFPIKRLHEKLDYLLKF